MNFKFELYMRVSCTFRINRYNRNLAGSTCSAILNILYSLWVIVRILEIYFSLTSSWMNKCPFRVQVVLTDLNMLFIYQLKLTIFLANSFNDISIIIRVTAVYIFLFQNFQNLFSKLLFISSTISEIHCIFFFTCFQLQ